MNMTAPCLDHQSLVHKLEGDQHPSDSQQRDSLGEVPARYRHQHGSINLEQLEQDQRRARQQVLKEAIKRVRAWWQR
ncbi:hypothetical protein GCM10011297_31770 [Bacterioplanes sanyensis]|uniref:hypothetical protein n=1 Tax=Bacterioplanes sanyensis TaxID=1249553 RepID=UPI0016780E28|nr:hypothetical protein [Bacterioplanes sanyensis]GGY56594.1 hypothetical protein GCM10011297_31770 [Bacterioplanes sanyensis]